MDSSRVNMFETVLWKIEEYNLRFPGEPALESVMAQIRYLIQIERGETADRSRLNEITIGRLAVYELSNIISGDLSEMLCDISDSVRRQLRSELRRQ